MTTNKRKYWFPAKKIGWGWGFPCAWQGWVVLIGFLVLVYGSTLFLIPKHPLAFVAWVTLCGIVLVSICWATGERPGGGNTQ